MSSCPPFSVLRPLSTALPRSAALFSTDPNRWVTKLAKPQPLVQISLMKQVHYTLYREGPDFVAQCLDFDVSSFGESRQEALAMLKEAIELYLEDDDTNAPFPQISEVTVGELAIA